jgi:hypothetical protein
VIPCYRYGHYLPEAVRTTLRQEGVRIDIVIVDDASPDDSAEVARALADQHDNVSLIVHAENKGHIATYNDGLAAATGKYVVLLSADDLLAPGALARSSALMEWNPAVSFVYGYAPYFSDQPPEPRRSHYSWSIWSGEQWIERLCVRGNNVVTNPEVVMRREVMHDLGGYDSTLPHAADLLIWLRAAVKGPVGRVNGPDQAYYRIHGTNMHFTHYAGVLTDLRERRRTFDTFLTGELAGHPRRQHLTDLAYKALAVESLRWAIRARDMVEDNWRESMKEYGDIALSLWPRITSTALWHRYLRRTAEASGNSFDQLLFRADWELRHKLRWHRWRRFGT